MTTLERKKILKMKIDNTFSEEVLTKIEKILEEQKIFNFSKEEIITINEAKIEYLKGAFLNENDANEDIEKWFKKEN